MKNNGMEKGKRGISAVKKRSSRCERKSESYVFRDKLSTSTVTLVAAERMWT